MPSNKILFSGLIAVVLALFVFASVAEAGTRDQKKYMTGWEFDRAPTTTQFSLYTDANFNGNTGIGDAWSWRIRLNGEFAMPFYEAFSVFAQAGYLIDDQDPLTPTTDGVEDLQVGVKWAFLDFDQFILTAAMSATIPFNTGGSLQDTFLASIWIMSTLFLLNSDDFCIGGNVNVRFGNFFNTTPGDNDWFNFHGTVEGFMTLFSTLTGKLGFDIDYVGGSFDNMSSQVYLEGQFLFDVFAPFLRIILPFDVSNPFTSIENGITNGDFGFILGFTIIL